MKKLFKDIDFSTWFIVIGLFILYFCTRNTMGLMDNDNMFVLSTTPMNELASQINANSLSEPQPTTSENTTQQCSSVSTQDIGDTTSQLTKSITDLQQRIKADQNALKSVQELTNSLSNSIDVESEQQQTTENIQDSTDEIKNSITQLISRVKGDMSELNNIQTMLGTLTDSTKQATDIAIPKELSDADKAYINSKVQDIQTKRKSNYETLKKDIENDVYCQTAAYYANKTGIDYTATSEPWYTNFKLPEGVECNPLSTYESSSASISTAPYSTA